MLKKIDHIFNAKTALAKLEAVPEAVAILKEKLMCKGYYIIADLLYYIIANRL